jgi:hypothetical protein
MWILLCRRTEKEMGRALKFNNFQIVLYLPGLLSSTEFRVAEIIRKLG